MEKIIDFQVGNRKKSQRTKFEERMNEESI